MARSDLCATHQDIADQAACLMWSITTMPLSHKARNNRRMIMASAISRTSISSKQMTGPAAISWSAALSIGSDLPALRASCHRILGLNHKIMEMKPLTAQRLGNIGKHIHEQCFAPPDTAIKIQPFWPFSFLFFERENSRPSPSLTRLRPALQPAIA